MDCCGTPTSNSVAKPSFLSKNGWLLQPSLNGRFLVWVYHATRFSSHPTKVPSPTAPKLVSHSAMVLAERRTHGPAWCLEQRNFKKHPSSQPKIQPNSACGASRSESRLNESAQLTCENDEIHETNTPVGCLLFSITLSLRT